MIQGRSERWWTKEDTKQDNYTPDIGLVRCHDFSSLADSKVDNVMYTNAQHYVGYTPFPCLL